MTTAFLADQAVAGVDAPLIASAAKLADHVRDHSVKRAALAASTAAASAKAWGVAIGAGMLAGILGAVLITTCKTASAASAFNRRQPEPA